jgi:hypothetical protein
MNAINKWRDKSYLKQKFNNVSVNIEQYKSQDDMEVSKCSKKKVYFDDYLENLHDEWYLADCPLYEMDIDGSIYNDINNPYFSGPLKETPIENLLFIGKNTKTGAHIHIGPYDFVLNQIVGKKKVHLLDFEELTLNPLLSKRYNFSKENFFNLDISKYKIHTFELEPGDVLYLPPWIWHAVENIGYSIGLTKVFKRDDDYLKLKRFKQLKYRNRFRQIIDNIQSLIKI